jgi:hypothetical protein
LTIRVENIIKSSPDLIKALVAGNKNYYDLGAVIPDTPFYYFLGRGSREFLSAGWRLHGQNGEDTFSFLPVVSRFVDLRSNDSVWALLLGVLTHIIADSVFHPFVYHFSGNPLHPDPEISRGAAYRHRMIETYLDLHYMQRLALAHRGKLSVLLESSKMDQRKFVPLLSCLFFSRPDYSPAEIQKALRMHASVQSYFYKRPYAAVVRAFNLLSQRRLDSITALFYPHRRDLPVALSHHPLHYLHPVTGEECLTSLHEIEYRVVEKCQEVFSQMESWRREENMDFLKEELRGPSAYTGLYASKSVDMTHFHIQNVKELYCI